MKFKPMLATNADLMKLKLPVYGSLKLEGVRGEFTPTGLLTRPLKRFGNKWLEIKFREVLEYAKEWNLVIEGEFYKHGLEFNEISSICRRAQHPDTDELEFHIFDVYSADTPNVGFEHRIEYLIKPAVKRIKLDCVKYIEQVKQVDREEVELAYADALERGYEGWVVKSPNDAYKQGRSTVNEGFFLRLKDQETYDGVVVEIVERMENLCESEVNELGKLSKRQDKDMKAHTGLAAVAVVKAEGFRKLIRVSLSRGILDYSDTKKSPSRATIFNERDSFIGRNIRFVGIPVAGMEVPRSPRFDDWRTDLD
jgi:DNA ligase-1